MIKRKQYLDLLRKWKDDKIIKVVTGIRRCGKSTLLEQFQQELLDNGIKSNQIIAINFESLEYEELLDYKELNNFIMSKVVDNKMNYIFLDEVQKVNCFEKVVDSLYIKDNIDIYITGSNSNMFSSELATLLSGRYIEIKMLPLSFKEYAEANGENNEKILYDYINKGGFPYVASIKDEEKIDMYLEGIYNTILVKDIEDRAKRGKLETNRRDVTDILLLKSVINYLADISGNVVSIKKITDYIVSTGRKVSCNTISDYVKALVEAFVFYPVDRYNIQGKELLKSNKKYYVVDLGLRKHLINKNKYDIGYSLENIVYFELLRRGYKVNIGKNRDQEIDFIATKNNVIEYFQVTASMLEESTFNREIGAFKGIKDSYPKYVLTLDNVSLGNYNGIQVVNLLDWLMQ